MSAAAQLITGVDFASIPTKDLKTAVEFYGTTLGLPRSVYLEERNYAEFETGNLTLSVIDPDAMGIEHPPTQNLALHVDDMEQARSTLEARGVSFNGDTFDTGVCYMAFFADPDGNQLMLHHRYVPRSTQAG
jgi:predicted enzyme related to lactoylglutathione lyase